MSNISDYFSGVTYHPVYHLGDRVRGIWQNIPVSGTVLIDRKLDEDGPAVVIVELDLPVKAGGSWFTTIKMAHEQIIKVEDSYGTNRKTSAKRRTVGSN